MGLKQSKVDHNFSEELFIFERMAGGDQLALRFFFDKYYHNLCNYVNLYVHDQQVAEDIVQEIFIYLWEKRESIRMNTSVKSYLFQASRNKFLNHIRDSKKHKEINEIVTSAIDTTFDPDDNQLIAGQLEDLIVSSIDQLPPRCREIYQLHRNGDLSYKEIAIRMNISVKTVENQMTIALKKLKEQLAPYYDQLFALIIMGLLGKL
jgi:RNA polymerase sigma-70 factor (ECF subfamily)